MNIAGDVTNGTVTKYIRGIQLISSKTGSSESFYNYNGHGDVVQLTDNSGVITKQYSYDAFGVEIDKVDSDTNPFRYCGEYYDTETDSVYLRARYYSPVSGRFITEDPIRDGLNWYVYCEINPIIQVDPNGEDAIILTNENAVNSGDYTGIQIGNSINFGHTGVLVQDCNGTWVYFSCGEGYTIWCTVDTQYMTDLKTFSDNYYTGGTYTTSTYIKGNFTDSCNYFYEYANGNPNNKEYNVLSNNCVQVVMTGIKKGKLQNGTTVSSFTYDYSPIIPNIAKSFIRELFYNDSWTYGDYHKQINDQLWEATEGIWYNRNPYKARRLEALI